MTKYYRLNDNTPGPCHWGKHDHPDMGKHYGSLEELNGQIVKYLTDLGPDHKVVQLLDSDLYFWIEIEGLTRLSPIEVLAILS